MDPASVDLTVVNVSGRSGVATEALGLLNDTGFGVTDADLLAPDGDVRPGVTVEYDPANLAAALTVAATVKGAELVPTDGLGKKVRLLLGKGWDGTITAVTAGAKVTGTVATGSAAAPSGAPPTLTSGELPSINAGQQLCA